MTGEHEIMYVCLLVYTRYAPDIYKDILNEIFQQASSSGFSDLVVGIITMFLVLLA